MNTKKELLDRICALMPEARGQVTKILADYRVAKDTSRDSSTLDKQITIFLAAKKIDGLSAKTIKNYRDILVRFCLAGGQACRQNLHRRYPGLYRVSF